MLLPLKIRLGAKNGLVKEN